jgi:GT2 family glycosyltransferase
VVRKSAYVEAGGLDGDFFMHMEELDLCWRFWLMGWEVKVAPKGVVYHYAGAALAADRFHKMYYNHRNGLVMLLKNYSLPSLLRFLPIRIGLDWVTVAMSLFRREPKRSLAVLVAHGYVLFHLPHLIAKRWRVQRMRKVADRDLSAVILPGSIVWRYFVQRQKTFAEIWAVR